MAKRSLGFQILVLIALVLGSGCAQRPTSPEEQSERGFTVPSLSQKVEVAETAVVESWAITLNWYELNELLVLNVTVENQGPHRRNPPIVGLSGTHKVEAEGRPLPAQASVTIVSGPNYVVTGRIGLTNPCFPCDLSSGDSLTYQVTYPVRGEMQAFELVYSPSPRGNKEVLFQFTRNHTWSVQAPVSPPPMSSRKEVEDTVRVGPWAITLNWYDWQGTRVRLAVTVQNRGQERRQPPLLGYFSVDYSLRDDNGNKLIATFDKVVSAPPGVQTTVSFGNVPILAPDQSLTYEAIFSGARKEAQMLTLTYLDPYNLLCGDPCRQVLFTLERPRPLLPDRGFILLAGICSSTEENKKRWMPRLEQWLKGQFPERRIIQFSYSSEGWHVDYNGDDTFRSIKDSSQNLKAIYDAHPNSTFDVIGHSLGGVVALYFLADPRNEGYRARTNSVITVDSPVRGAGIDTLEKWVNLWPGCPSPLQSEHIAEQLAFNGPVPTMISVVSRSSWNKPKILTATNIIDTLIVPPDSAILVGSAITSVQRDAGPTIDPNASAIAQLEGRVDAHSAILAKLPSWFTSLLEHWLR